MDLCNPKTLQALLGRHGFRFSKSLGQNFLIDPQVPSDIADASGADDSCGVLEIGPGVGPLTAELARRAGRVAAVELDRRLLPVLEETLSECSNVSIVQGDAMKLDLSELMAEQLGGLRPIACANLPYNITTPILTRLLESGLFERITVMIQREVALRICAAPGTADYGAFSVFCQYYAECALCFLVPPECFLPAPKVTSAVITLVPRRGPHPLVENEALFFRVVRASFAQRRKTLVNGLSAVFSSQLDKETLRQVLAACSLSPTIRGETLGIPDFARLTHAIDTALRG